MADAGGVGLIADLRLRRSEAFALDVSLAIAPGHTVALVGPNGSGKSTAVAALAGLLPLDAGRIVVAGTVLDDPEAGVYVPPEERKVGVVFQDYLLFPHLTVVENVAFGLRSRRVRRSEALERAGQWIERLGLGGLAFRKPRQLSGGQAQRVALARALVIEPDLLLLDEPLSALDVTTRVQLRRTLAQHLESFRGPRMVITHDPIEAFLLADEIHVIEAGSVVQSGTADDIRLRPRTAYVADLAGTNLFTGVASAGRVAVGEHTLHIADSTVTGDVLVAILPNAVTVHLEEPAGSERNRWATTLEAVENLGERVRMKTGAPLPLTVEVTAASASELGLVVGRRVWVALKATEIGVQPDSQHPEGQRSAPPDREEPS